jgi:lipopolysaccharide transport system permease protein
MLVEFGPEAGRSTKRKLGEVWINLVRNRGLIRELATVSLTAQFKKSLLGASWIVLFPLFNVIVWLFLHAVGVMDPGVTAAPYPVYLLLGMVTWFLFIGYFKEASDVIVQGGRLFMQVRFPHEVFLFQRLLVHTINGFIPLVIIMIAMPLWGVVPQWQSIFLPIAILPLMWLGTAVGLLAAILRVVAIDAFNILSKVMELILYLTPVIYATDAGGSTLNALVSANPLTYIINSCRNLVLTGEPYQWETTLLVAAGSLLLFLICLRIFLVAEPRVIEKLAL